MSSFMAAQAVSVAKRPAPRAEGTPTRNERAGGSCEPRPMESNAGGNDKSSDSHECPTCGRDNFSRRQDMTTHHKKAHGESIAGVELTCEWCGGVYRKEHHAADESRFCSYECKGEWQSENVIGEKHPSWEGGEVELICEQCGEGYQVRPHEATTSRFCSYRCMGKSRIESYSEVGNPSWSGGKIELVCEQCGEGYQRFPAYAEESRFCSQSCCGEWQSENQTGEDNPHWLGGAVELTCNQCGELYQERRDKISRSRFCSRECYGEWRSEARSGKNHPQWKGGEFAYGKGWNKEKRKLVRERDGRECRICEMGEETHIERYGYRHPVHHIVPARWFDDPNPRNAESNLITLCCPCHKIVEQMAPLLPDGVRT